MIQLNHEIRCLLRGVHRFGAHILLSWVQRHYNVKNDTKLKKYIKYLNVKAMMDVGSSCLTITHELGNR